MNWIQTVFCWMSPSLMLRGSPWYGMWLHKQKQSFAAGMKPFFAIAGTAYALHFFFYDLPNQLQPLEIWFGFRFGMASLAIAGYLICSVERAPSWILKSCGLSYCFLICLSQALVAASYGRESWVFCYILVIACSLGLRMSAFSSALFSISMIIIQAPLVLESGIPFSYVFTGSVVAVSISIVVRLTGFFEANSFRLDQENLEAQRKIIELSIEFSDRLRSFIPKVIARRIEDFIESKGMNIIESSVQVLAPKRREIACLFSDIRGFTQKAESLDNFLVHSVLPEVKACTDVIEEMDGIPRKVGDLIFAYYDDDSNDRNILNCVASGIEISRVNEAINETLAASTVTRYVVLSEGEAIVGNIGGLDSSVEITALGPPVNLLSRLDELTKTKISEFQLVPGDLILSPSFADRLKRLVPPIELRAVSLESVGVKVRDFPDVSRLFILKPSGSNLSYVLEVLDGCSTRHHTSGDPQTVAA